MVRDSRGPAPDDHDHARGTDGRQRRVGLEDSLYLGRGELAQSSAEQVRMIRSVLEPLGFEVATPSEAREMLGLKDKDKVNLP